MRTNARAAVALVMILCVIQPAPGRQAQDDAARARAEVCKRVACRPATTVRLRLNKEEYFEMDFPSGPYVADGFINVLAGEGFAVEFDEAGGKLSDPRYVKTAAGPGRTVSFRLEQTDEGTVLSVKNPFAQAITYDCLIQRHDEQRLRRTTIVPVPAGLVSFEMWPYPVAQAVISNVRFVPKSSG